MTAGNQLSTLAAARLEQNLQHYDLLGERYGGRWWLHSAQIHMAAADMAAAEGWGEQQRAALERLERFLRSEQQKTHTTTERDTERVTGSDTEAACSGGDAATMGEEMRDRLLYVLH